MSRLRQVPPGKRMRCRDERGAAAVEWALLAPVLVLILGVMVAGWRLSSARMAVQQAAQAGARAASLQSGPNQADAAGRAQVAANLSGVPCVQPVVVLDTAGLTVPSGTPAAVRATVSCRVALADLVVPGLPGTVTVTGEASTPVDRYGRR